MPTNDAKRSERMARAYADMYAVRQPLRAYVRASCVLEAQGSLPRGGHQPPRDCPGAAATSGAPYTVTAYRGTTQARARGGRTSGAPSSLARARRLRLSASDRARLEAGSAGAAEAAAAAAAAEETPAEVAEAAAEAEAEAAALEATEAAAAEAERARASMWECLALSPAERFPSM